MIRSTSLVSSQKALRNICLTVASLILPNLVFGQIALPGSQSLDSCPFKVKAGFAEQRAKAETQLAETQRQRDAELPGSHEVASADAVRTADRQRLLDRLAFLQGERIKKLDEQAALQKAPPFLLSNLPQVQALGESPPLFGHRCRCPTGRT